MRVGVVGGYGFVGRHVVSSLAGDGWEIVTVEARAPFARVGRETVVLADLGDGQAAARSAVECGHLDAVVWLAATIASPPITSRRAVTDFAVMVEGPVRFLDALPNPPISVVYAS